MLVANNRLKVTFQSLYLAGGQAFVDIMLTSSGLKQNKDSERCLLIYNLVW